MPKRRALGGVESSARTRAEQGGGTASALAAAIEALGIAEDEVIGHREYAEAVVIVTWDGRKLTCPKSPQAG